MLCAVGSTVQVVVVVIVVVVEMPGGVGKGCSIHGSLLVFSGIFWTVAQDADVNVTKQASFDVFIAAAVAAASAVAAAALTACFGENVKDL